MLGKAVASFAWDEAKGPRELMPTLGGSEVPPTAGPLRPRRILRILTWILSQLVKESLMDSDLRYSYSCTKFSTR